MKRKNLNHSKGIDFTFIVDETLQENIELTKDYIYTLINLSHKAEANLKASFYKDIIIHTAAIVEAILHYVVKSIPHEIPEKEWTYQDPKVIYEIGKNHQVISGIRVKRQIEMKRNIDFKTVNEIAKKLKIFDNPLFEECEHIRTIRNRIHLAGLSEVDKNYDIKNVNTVIEILVRLLKRINTVIDLDSKN